MKQRIKTSKKQKLTKRENSHKEDMNEELGVIWNNSIHKSTFAVEELSQESKNIQSSSI